jgi:hypothetical protein
MCERVNYKTVLIRSIDDAVGKLEQHVASRSMEVLWPTKGSICDAINRTFYFVQKTFRRSRASVAIPQSSCYGLVNRVGMEIKSGLGH